MILLYQAGGASDFTILQDGLTHDQCGVLFENAARLLSARSQARAAEMLRSVPFRVVEATNHFNDEFSMLHAVVPLEEYERLRRSQQDPAEGQAFGQVAEVLSELDTYIRFIAVELAPPRTTSNTCSGLPEPRARHTRTSDIPSISEKSLFSRRGCRSANHRVAPWLLPIIRNNRS